MVHSEPLQPGDEVPDGSVDDPLAGIGDDFDDEPTDPNIPLFHADAMAVIGTSADRISIILDDVIVPCQHYLKRNKKTLAKQIGPHIDTHKGFSAGEEYLSVRFDEIEVLLKAVEDACLESPRCLNRKILDSLWQLDQKINRILPPLQRAGEYAQGLGQRRAASLCGYFQQWLETIYKMKSDELRTTQKIEESNSLASAICVFKAACSEIESMTKRLETTPKRLPYLTVVTWIRRRYVEMMRYIEGTYRTNREALEINVDPIALQRFQESMRDLVRCVNAVGEPLDFCGNTKVIEKLRLFGIAMENIAMDFRFMVQVGYLPDPTTTEGEFVLGKLAIPDSRGRSSDELPN